LTESGSLILSEPLGTGDAIVVTGSGNGCPLFLSNDQDLGPDHQISIDRRNDAVLKFNEFYDRVHVQTVRSRPDCVNWKLQAGIYAIS
jgi:hypothetical protein